MIQTVLPHPLALLTRLVNTPSMYTEPPYETRVAEMIEPLLVGMGFTVIRQPVHSSDGLVQTPTRYNLLAEKGTGDRALLLYGHMDTVPIAQGWEHHPHSAVQDDDRVYGLGAYDMKTGLVTLLHAAQAMQPEGFRLKLAFLVDEENNSLGAYRLIQSGWLSDVRAAMVPESGSSQRNQLGPRMVTLGRRGRISIQVTVRGLAAHAAAAHLGESALIGAARFAVALNDAAHDGKLLPAHDPLLGRAGFSVRTFRSAAGGLSVPDSATLIIDRHLVRGETPEAAMEDARRVLAEAFTALATESQERLGYEVTIPDRGNPYLMPYVTDAGNPFVRLVESIIKRELGVGDVPHNYGASVADENYFGAAHELGGLAIPTVVVGPIGANGHAHDEWVSARSLSELITIYSAVIARFGEIASSM